MGDGEYIYNQFYRWFSTLPEPQRNRVEERNPEPEGWRGFYATIRAHPWSEK
jgi:hypothetical protein